MVTDGPEDDSRARTAAQFATTHWSVVLAAGDSGSPDSREALETLCRQYWYPLYVFVRRKGHPPADAQDLTQGFFEEVLRKHCVREAVREKGRFRTFLLTILQRFLLGEFDRATARKRGGIAPRIPVDEWENRGHLAPALAHSENPEDTFDRAWAETVIQSSVKQLGEEYAASGRRPLFAEIQSYLSRPADRAAYTQSGRRLGISADAVAMAVVRLRRRYREIVRNQVAQTVATPAEIDDEMRYLVRLLTR
jgi:DNA-directed RNA polymerase specialized sigma24 family protein